MGNRDSEIVDLRGLTLVHRDTSNRTLAADNWGPNDGVTRERLPRGRAAVRSTRLPCSCGIARTTKDRPDICATCGGNANKRFDPSPLDKLRERDPQAYRRALLAMGIPAATIDAALVEDLKRAKAEEK